MIAISEYSNQIEASAGKAYLRKMEESAKLVGITILNFDKKELNHLEEILERKFENLNEETIAYWIGFVPSFEEYSKVYELLKKYNLNLINSPEEFAKSEYFDQFYGVIEPYSIESGIAEDIESAIKISQSLNYPIFLKGNIQSLKKFGWENCIAKDELELIDLCNKILSKPSFSRGKIVLRNFVELENNGIGGNGIPNCHEYRLMYLKNKMIDYSFYWNGKNPFRLKNTEKTRIFELGEKVSKELGVPFISIDIAKTKNQGWKVIEVGDGQFSDIRQISSLKFWNYIFENK